ncbi:hypothetical protein [Leptospira sarikeiensis]|uniref:Uncharacterized protein n=1 Tax=Leptospira sarikeiensis TaxID=2484943 RepID=A0A4R9K558_9LEPT|nr:hypothetical protein [Leptospira sarikeiensis]TGL60643.1 hypothetical protein EHQ64_12505 [Leptospira sarikeiensis]
MNSNVEIIERNLLAVIEEIAKQESVGALIPDTMLSLEGLVERLREYINIAGEYAIAYEIITSSLEKLPFTLQGGTIIKLIDVALIMGYRYKKDL